MNLRMREPLLDVIVRRGGDEWNLSHPEAVQAIQRRYVEAGSQIVLTNTFGTNRFVLSRYGLEERVAEIARAAAINARAAAGTRAHVLGEPLVVASMSYDPVRGGGYKTMMGVSPGDGARACLAAGAQIVGANCGRMEPEEFADVARAMRTVTDAPLILQPNAGQPTLVGDAIVYPRDPASLARALVELSRHAAIVGGCCGTTPAHIEAFRRALR